MDNNVIMLPKPAEYNELTVLKQQLESAQARLNERKQEINEIKSKIQDLSVEILEPGLKLAQKKLLQQQKKKEEGRCIDIERILKTIETDINNIETEIKLHNKQQNRTQAVDKTMTAVAQALAYFNAHYIVNEDLWYVAYLNESTVRQSVPVITNYKTNIFCNVVEYFTDWRPNDQKELIAIAKAADRCKLSVERTFLSADPRVYNQMDSLRELWLKPLDDGHSYHEAFDILMATIVDDRPDYIEQLEKLVAYTYCHPEDLQTPSIDSIAVGGSGRGTLWKILEIIFTEECCGSASKETFSGTHNGELWGKVWVRISEQDSTTIDAEELKNLTGSKNFRLRRMGQDAVNSPRTFRFFMETNKYGGTAKYTGTGKASTERRYEPIITKLTLLQKIQRHYQCDDDSAWEILQAFQDIYDDRIEIARWLHHIITKHDAHNLNGVRAIHGECYHMVCERQINAFDTFMETVFTLSVKTNTYDYRDLAKIYKLATGKTNTDAAKFAQRVAEWLIKRTGNDWLTGIKDVWDWEDNRVRRHVIYQPHLLGKKGGPNSHKLLWDVAEYIDTEMMDPKKPLETLGSKITVENIRRELL